HRLVLVRREQHRLRGNPGEDLRVIRPARRRPPAARRGPSSYAVLVSLLASLLPSESRPTRRASEGEEGAGGRRREPGHGLPADPRRETRQVALAEVRDPRHAAVGPVAGRARDVSPEEDPVAPGRDDPLREAQQLVVAARAGSGHAVVPEPRPA